MLNLSKANLWQKQKSHKGRWSLNKLLSFKDRITTTDDDGSRVRVIPMAVRGRWQRIKSIVHIILVGVFLSLPWIKINNAPALQLDVEHRRFFLAGHLFLPQDVPGIFFVISSFAMGLLFFTALFGRVWCGWACPQTVFIEGFFRRVERFVEGDHIRQRMLDKSVWNFEKVYKKTLKWAIFTFGALVVTHSFLAYFVGADNVLHMILKRPTENPGSFALMAVSTLVFLFDLGWFREQFCLIACPYGRFQSALMDENSKTIAYDMKRDTCINCLKCVKVCPTGIDIRNGFQMECIACTACADVCDEVMDKIGKPRGLIRYASEAELRGEKTQILRPRIILYGLLFAIMLSGLSYRIWSKEIFETEILRATDSPYQLLKGESGDEAIINHFKVNWYNLSAQQATVELQLSSEDLAAGYELIQSTKSMAVPSGQHARHQFFIKFPRRLNAQGKMKLKLQSVWQIESEIKKENVDIVLIGPSHDV